SAVSVDVNLFCSCSFIPAVNELSAKLATLEIKNLELETDLRSLRQKLTDALVLEKTLEKDLKKAEEQCSTEKAKLEIKMQNLTKLKAKSEEYKYKIQTAKDELTATGLEDSLTHKSLMSLSETLTELKAQSTATKEKLKSYLDLAPVSNGSKF
ncbi:hypothetical protein GDO81_004657, partial [Engystomops pustulosus]